MIYRMNYGHSSNILLSFYKYNTGANLLSQTQLVLCCNELCPKDLSAETRLYCIADILLHLMLRIC